jgi:hypothetical protein
MTIDRPGLANLLARFYQYLQWILQRIDVLPANIWRFATPTLLSWPIGF